MVVEKKSYTQKAISDDPLFNSGVHSSSVNWTSLILTRNQESLPLKTSATLCKGYSTYHADTCSSTMDLAWLLYEKGMFPLWASVLSDHQKQGRGQFSRSWISEPGNLHATVRIPVMTGGKTTAPLVVALAVNEALATLNIPSEYKWPNDMVVGGKKVGGILVEERDGILMAGIGLNLSSAPTMSDLKDMNVLAPGHLHECGPVLSPFELWPVIIESLTTRFSAISDPYLLGDVVTSLNRVLAFKNETVVFSPPSGPEFSAVISGLSPEGGLCLKTVDGEKTFFSGSFIPVVH